MFVFVFHYRVPISLYLFNFFFVLSNFIKQCVTLMHIKFDDKEPGSKTPEQDESFADIQVPKNTPEPDQIAESEDSPEVEPTSEEQDEVASDEAQDGSQHATQSKNTFKYKSSHPEDQIIGNEESPRRTRSYFGQ
jgi:hypothetical protein